jgi:hypothetical protein
VAVLSRRMRGSPSEMELALRSNISDYLSIMEQRLSEPGNQVLSDPSYAESARSYLDQIKEYDEKLAAALTLLYNRLTLNNKFGAANEKPVLDALQRVRNLLKEASAIPARRVREEKALWRRLKPWKRRNNP